MHSLYKRSININLIELSIYRDRWYEWVVDYERDRSYQIKNGVVAGYYDTCG